MVCCVLRIAGRSKSLLGLLYIMFVLCVRGGGGRSPPSVSVVCRPAI